MSYCETHTIENTDTSGDGGTGFNVKSVAAEQADSGLVEVEVVLKNNKDSLETGNGEITVDGQSELLYNYTVKAGQESTELFEIELPDGEYQICTNVGI